MGFSATPQFRLDDGPFLAVVDFLLEDHRVVIEFDGFVKYGDGGPLDTSPTPADVCSPRRSARTGSARLGHEVVRVVWRDFEDLPLLPPARRVAATEA